MRAPFPWYGGKQRLARKLLRFIPAHTTYVEVFGGSAALLFAKDPRTSQLEVYNDIDSGLVNFFRVLRDREKAAELQRLLRLTPYSREEYCFCREHWAEAEDDVEKARRWYVVAVQSFAGRWGNSWGFDLVHPSMAKKWVALVERLPGFSERFRHVQVENCGFLRILELYDSEETFFYCDPPYILETRIGGKAYAHEMDMEAHEMLHDALLRVRGMAMLSGYRHPLHEKLEKAGWERHDFEVKCTAVGRTRATGFREPGGASGERFVRVESIWLNPAASSRLPVQLSLLGGG